MLYLFMHKLLLWDTGDDHNLAAACLSRNSTKGEHENAKFQKVIIQNICLVVQVNQHVQHAELA